MWQIETMSPSKEQTVDKSRVLAHVGLASVTYFPLALYILFVLTIQRDAVAEVFTSGAASFLGYFATAMTMFGWPLLFIAILISLRGLAKRTHVALNAVSLGCCLAWFAGAYWILTHFR
jgi:hypothetical protein